MEVLQLRAGLLRRTRQFFDREGVLEVETPILGRATVTDPHIDSIPAGDGYLQTSPEFAMKRLLAAGSGSIFQITKAFRRGETGRRHNPEFTMLEWYRVGFDHHRLMDDVEALLHDLLDTGVSERHTYGATFRDYVGIDPHTAEARDLQSAAARMGVSVGAPTKLSREDWLNLLMAQVIEPRLGERAPVFVYDFPKELAALAKIRHEGGGLAERFELYFHGTELANGYHELTDAQEQRERFESDLALREMLGRETVEADPNLLAAIEAGLPDCSGVAVGFDRLVMIAAGKTSLDEVLSFPTSRA